MLLTVAQMRATCICTVHKTSETENTSHVPRLPCILHNVGVWVCIGYPLHWACSLVDWSGQRHLQKGQADNQCIMQARMLVLKVYYLESTM